MSDNITPERLTCAPEHKKANGQCRRCKKCLECCGNEKVSGSCRYRDERMTPEQHARSARSTGAYWRSVEAGRQRR